jgi:Na+/H+ antiporter NhaA
MPHEESDMWLTRIIIVIFAFFILPIFLFDSAYATVSEGCEIFEIKAGCDLSVWMAVIIGEIGVGAFLAIFLHYLEHKSHIKLEKDSEQLKDNSKTIHENSIAIQKILDA